MKVKLAVVGILVGCIIGYFAAHHFALWGGFALLGEPYSLARDSLVPGHMFFFSVALGAIGLFTGYRTDKKSRMLGKMLPVQRAGLKEELDWIKGRTQKNVTWMLKGLVVLAVMGPAFLTLSCDNLSSEERRVLEEKIEASEEMYRKEMWEAENDYVKDMVRASSYEGEKRAKERYAKRVKDAKSRRAGAEENARRYLNDKKAEQRLQLQQEQVAKDRTPAVLYEIYRNKDLDTARVNSDGTVTIGNLQWMRCSLGQKWNENTCTGSATEHNWDVAISLPGLMNGQGGFADHSDWRLPTIAELASLRVCSSERAEKPVNLPGGQKTFERCAGDYNKRTIDTRLFPNTQGTWFWSSSPYAYYADSAWYVNFDNGSVNGNFKYGNFGVRLVRAGQ